MRLVAFDRFYPCEDGLTRQRFEYEDGRIEFRYLPYSGLQRPEAEARYDALWSLTIE